MYDYVLQLSFSRDVQEKIQDIKEEIRKNNIEDKEREWKPHITIDLYNCKNQEEFIKKIDLIVEKVKPFDIKCKNLNNFDEVTLYIEPYDKKEIHKIKELFDKELEQYRLEHRKARIYKPHITLCTTTDLREATKIAKKKFKEFTTQIKYLWVYNSNLELIKEYELK